jgi:high-affinity iron transporter
MGKVVVCLPVSCTHYNTSEQGRREKVDTRFMFILLTVRPQVFHHRPASLSDMPLFDFAVITIFARECLEGGIIFGEYRTIVLRSDSLATGIRKDDALFAISISAVIAAAFAVIVIAATAITLAILSSDFDDTTAKIIEGICKIVAAISVMQLSLKIPKWFGVYGRKAIATREGGTRLSQDGLTLRSIRFNVALNIWREVAECGVFLIPFFLTGEGIESIPLSALIGSCIGLILAAAVYVATQRVENKLGITVFAVLLIVTLSAGLIEGGFKDLEKELGSTKTVWEIDGGFWDAHRLPMTLLKPFGWDDSRTVLQISSYWGTMLVGALLHYRKYRISPKVNDEEAEESPGKRPISDDEEVGSLELGGSSLEGSTAG